MAFHFAFQGRLPIDNAAIDDALELGVTQCLQLLQTTNPNLLLTASELRKAERDARYVPAVSLALASILTKSVIDPDPTIVERIRRWDTSIDIPTNVVSLSADYESPRSPSSNKSERPGKGFNTVDVEALGMLIEGRLRLILSQQPEKVKAKKKNENDEEESKTSEASSLDSSSLNIDWDLLEKATEGDEVSLPGQHLASLGSGDIVPKAKLGNSSVLDDATFGDYDDWL
jgi:hypothetical protein